MTPAPQGESNDLIHAGGRLANDKPVMFNLSGSYGDIQRSVWASPHSIRICRVHPFVIRAESDERSESPDALEAAGGF